MQTQLKGPCGSRDLARESHHKGRKPQLAGRVPGPGRLRPSGSRHKGRMREHAGRVTGPEQQS